MLPCTETKVGHTVCAEVYEHYSNIFTVECAGETTSYLHKRSNITSKMQTTPLIFYGPIGLYMTCIVINKTNTPCSQEVENKSLNRMGSW
jgi:hypothetical protein